MQFSAILPKLGIIFGSIVMTLGVITCFLTLNSILRDGNVKRKIGKEQKERWDYFAKSGHITDEYSVKKKQIKI
jgi:hypothetical protein